MLRAALPPLLPLAAAALAAPAAAGSEPQPTYSIAQVVIRQRVIVRVPRLPARSMPLPQPVEWKEGKGPKCVAAQSLAGAVIGGNDRVDLVLAGGRRVRAQLDGDCAPLDFYSGFYLRPAADGMVCARRDPIRVRSGASCPIRRFRTLTPRR